MSRYRKVPLFCFVLTVAVALCSGLILDRLPHHNAASESIFSHKDSAENDDSSESELYDASDEKNDVIKDQGDFNSITSQRALRPSWKSLYSFPSELHSFNSMRKRSKRQKVDVDSSESEKRELAEILKDDENVKEEEKAPKKEPSKHKKTKRQSSEETESKTEDADSSSTAETEEAQPHEDFQSWLRKEYYRNMARTFASMRRKRDGSTQEQPSHKPSHGTVSKRSVKRQKKSVSFEEVTDNLRAIEDVLFFDALQTMRESGDDYEDDVEKQNRITNDLSSAYDLETMRNALFRLKYTLGKMDNENGPDDEVMYKSARKRGDQCPSLDLLTSDCSSLGDIVSEGSLKRLLLHACNWHEVCYTCGEVYGLTSENCDVGFIEQSQTICRGDVPCESTASLLLLPLRQRRVFYKRSNPSVCLVDPCVEEFLRQGQ